MSKQAASPAIDWSQWDKLDPAPKKDGGIAQVTASVTGHGSVCVSFNAKACEELGLAPAHRVEIMAGKGALADQILVKGVTTGGYGLTKMHGAGRVVFKRASPLVQAAPQFCTYEKIADALVLVKLPAFQPRPADWRPPARKPKAASPAKDETAADGSALTAFDRKVKDLLAQRMNAPTIAKTLKQSTETVLASLRKQGLVA
jgi:hypothetical protein